jgi:hypothetical protein
VTEPPGAAPTDGTPVSTARPVLPPPATADAQDAPGASPVLGNLLLLVGLGVLVSGWILFYTDWFPVASGILGLGGLFAWAVFLGGLLTDDRKEALQAAFERRILMSRRTSAVCLILGATFLVGASLYGSIVIDSSADERGRLLAILPIGVPVAFGPDSDYLLPHTDHKHLVFTGWTGRQYTVKVSGLPPAQLMVRPLCRKPVAVPAWFGERVVLLVRPAPALTANAPAHALVVKRLPPAGERAPDPCHPEVIGRIEAASYHGQAVWVGCDANVDIPDKVIGSWRLELARFFERQPGSPPTTPSSSPPSDSSRTKQEEMLSRWLGPQSIGEGALLRKYDLIEVSLVAPEQGGERPISCRRQRIENTLGGPVNLQEMELFQETSQCANPACSGVRAR